MSKNWFTAHKDGLRMVAKRLVERRSFGIIGAELYQNVMDTEATECHIKVATIPGKPLIEISVIDNGPGYTDLSHAWTVYAPSEKKDDPTKAGRFNVGCKMALAFCKEARVHTTSGTVEFNDEGRHEYPRRKRDNGTEFWALMECTRQQYTELIEYMNKIIVRPGLKLFVNGDEIKGRKPIHTFEQTLFTEIGEDLRTSARKCEIQIFDVLPDEVPSLYELGIPVVETGDKWHYSIQQKVPLNVDRDNVVPSYLKAVRTHVLNEMHEKIEQDDTTEAWVNEASSDERCSDEATHSFMTKRFGPKRVSIDPTNPDANGAAITAGYNMISSHGLTKGQRANAKMAGALFSSSQAFPMEGKGAYSDDPNATPVEVIPREKWTPAMGLIEEYTRWLGSELLGHGIIVRFVMCHSFVGRSWIACYGDNVLDYNKFTMGNKFFEEGFTPRLDGLIIHELAHDKVKNHATDDFHEECCSLGAKLKRLALDQPDKFHGFASRFERRNNI